MARKARIQQAPPRPEKTKAEKYHDAVEELAFYEQELTKRLERERREFVDYTERLSKSPAYELSWGGKLFDTAAWIEALETALAYRNDREMTPSWASIREYVLRSHVMREIRSTSRSTSACSNLMDDSRRAAWANLYEEGLKYCEMVERRVQSLAFEVEAELTEKLVNDIKATLAPFSA